MDVTGELLLHSTIPESCLPVLLFSEGFRSSSCSPLLAAVTFVSFGVFCFLPLILDLCEESAMKKSRSHVQGEMAVTYRKIYEDMEGEAR